MKDLVESGLWGGGLLSVSGEMVARYNQCLVDMGLPGTQLVDFTIDCMGWSPDIAKEQRNQDYLSHTNANRMAIVLFPEQEQSPIYHPTHSFDWGLMRQWFRDHRPQIAEVTKHSGVWLDLEQDMDIYHTPDDLLLMASMKVCPWTPGRMMVKSREQKSLVSRFMHPNGPVADVAQMLLQVPNQLEKSVCGIGYIAHKPIVIDSMQYSVPSSFYTPTFGGVFVFRSSNKEREALVLLEDVVRDKGVNGSSDQMVLRTLKKLGLTSSEVGYWKDHLSRLEIIRDSFLMEVLDQTEPDLDFVLLDRVRQKAILTSAAVQEQISGEYQQLDQVIRHLRSGRVQKNPPKEISPYLVHPVEGLGEEESEVVWHALSLVCDGRSVVRLYRYDKQRFFSEYKNWSQTHKKWAKAMIQGYYQAKTSW